MVQFNIGKTNPEYVIAEFDDGYTTCSIYKNGEDSDGLTKDFVHPSSDPEYPIYKHRATLKTVTVQEGIVGLGGNAFAMTSITSISLPSTLKSLGVGCFNAVKTLTSIVLPNGLEQINRGAFQNCSNLQTIYLGEVSSEDPYPTATHDILPPSLKLLDKQAFYNCTSLGGRITIPSGVTAVGQNAFGNCSSLNGTLNFQNGVEEIGPWAFDRCAHVTGGITFPTSIKKIGPYAFQNCGFNGVITLNEGLESIGDGAFNQCANATNTTFTIPSTLTTIGGDTYAEVTETSATVTISEEGNTGIGSHVFYNFATKTCDEFVVSRGNQHFKAVDGVLMSLDGTRLVAYPPSKNGASYEIPEGVVKIDEMAFSRTSQGSAAQKLSTITLPNSYIIKTTDQETNILNRASGNSLSVALYTFNQVSSVEVKPDNPQYVSINGCLYSKNGLTLYYVPVYKSGSLRLSSLVNTAVLGAFYGFEKAGSGDEVYSQLTELIIPRYLTNVPNYEVTRMNNFLQTGNTITVKDGNPVLVVTGTTIMKLQPFSTGGLISNVKLISSGNVPTTDNLFKGEMAFGKIGDNYDLYVNADGSIQKIASSSVQESYKTIYVPGANIEVVQGPSGKEYQTGFGIKVGTYSNGQLVTVEENQQYIPPYAFDTWDAVSRTSSSFSELFTGAYMSIILTKAGASSARFRCMNPFLLNMLISQTDRGEGITDFMFLNGNLHVVSTETVGTSSLYFMVGCTMSGNSSAAAEFTGPLNQMFAQLLPYIDYATIQYLPITKGEVQSNGQ